MLRSNYFVAALAVVVIGSGCTGSVNHNEAAPADPVEQPAVTSSTPSLPSMQLTTLDNASVNLQDLKGKRVFVNLWATWCPPCVAEMPSIQALHDKTAGDKVAFVLLSLDKDFDTAKKWIRNKGYKLPVYYGGQDLPQLFQVQGIPSTFIFDESGNLIFRHTGMADYDQDQFVKLLRPDKG